MDRLAEATQGLKHLTIQGVVQGVGFRPFVYKLAKTRGLKGWVLNTSSAVEIEVEGALSSLEAFVQSLRAEAPPRAHIENVTVTDGEPKGYGTFEIRESRADEGYQLVSPDIATCDECLKELFDPHDRRYRYPFINCTNCGPRFTIIQQMPYDRPLTTMAKFRMCPLCLCEYEDPLNRRFHAQPNACPVCGPRLWLEDGRGQVVETGDVVGEVGRLLREGRIIAIKSLGGFQLACDATNTEAVDMLRRRKGRPHKPFALMMRNTEEVSEYCSFDDVEAELLRSPQAPIVLLPLRGLRDLSPLVAPGNCYMGVMLPYTPLHHLLLHAFGKPLVMTSGNISEEPIAKDNKEARRQLAGVADYFAVHDRGIRARYDDSVCFVSRGRTQPVRRARSYAPFPVKLPFAAPPLLAVGASEKNTFCLTRDRFAFLSQHMGDIENVDTLERFILTIDLFKKLFRIAPGAIAHDLHPDYLSTRYARGLASHVPLLGVQHHHAHVAACMVDNGLNEPVLGVSFDGSGFGTDRAVWGGEFMIATYEGFQRVGHIENMPLPGGEISIRKPYRLALAYVHTLLGELPGAPALVQVPAEERDVILSQIAGRVNTPLTSSCGRLFDSVAALLDVCATITFEGQAAIALEMAAGKNGQAGPYPFRVEKEDGLWRIKLEDLFRALVAGVTSGCGVPEMAMRFHTTVAHMIRETAVLISKETGITKVVLTGGCFQNRLLLGITVPLLGHAGLHTFIHRQVPCNDGAISLGQAAIAAKMLESK